MVLDELKFKDGVADEKLDPKLKVGFELVDVGKLNVELLPKGVLPEP